MPKQKDELLDDEDDLQEVAGADDSSSEDTDKDAGDQQGAEASAESDGDDEDRDAKRARRKEERQRRKEFERERRERDRRLIAAKDKRIEELQQRLERLETRSNGHDIARVDQAIDDAKATYQSLLAAKKEAVEKGDGSKVVELDEHVYQARRRLEALNNLRGKASQPKRDEPPQLDPRLVDNARSFMRKNGWYDPEGADEDSLIVLAIDEALTRQGYDPTTRDYWDELERRAKKKLPHRFEGRRMDDADDDDDEPAARRSPVGGSGTRRAAGADARSTFKLTQAQVQALKEAGMWDDVALRNKMIKRYREQQRVNGAAR